MIPLRNLKRFFYKTLRQPVYALKVLLKRLHADFYYSSGSGKSSYPEAVTLFLTHKCNLRCKMCGQWGEGGVSRKQSSQYITEELSAEELKKIIDGVSFFKPNITLFGGEPMLHPACVDIIKYIKHKGMHCLMITNGSLLTQKAQDLVDSGLDELNVSLDAGGALHNEIRGMPGIFEKIMEGFEKLNYFKEKEGKTKPLINLQCTITKYNYRHLEELPEAAGNARANSLTFHNLIFLDREVIQKQKEYDESLGCSSLDWQGFIQDPGIDAAELYKKAGMIKQKKYPFSVDFYPNFSYRALCDYYKPADFIPTEYSGRCLSPWMTGYIFPDGSLRPCLNFSYSFGNIKEKKFTDIWNSAEAVKYRRFLREKRIFPVCIRCTELYRY